MVFVTPNAAQYAHKITGSRRAEEPKKNDGEDHGIRKVQRHGASQR
jgi:hypothetical protein